MSCDLLKKGITDFSLISNTSTFVIKCLSRFRDKMKACPFPCYGNRSCKETNDKLDFGHMSKRWCSIKEIEVCLLCEILISKDTVQGPKKKSVASLLKSMRVK